jgi:predicted lysophospholipase L1 biosynthesis ABC-type transport system permease subunit
VVARRKPGVTMAAAAADLTAAVARWQTVTGEFHSPAPDFHPLEMKRLSEATSGAVARPLAALAAAVGLVLLIACANVANLMLGRAEGRRADLAIELALGADIRHLAGLYLTEAIVLATLGGAGGLALAAAAIDALKAFGPALVKPDDIVLNARVLAFAAAAAAATAAIIALVPTLRIDAMRSGSGCRPADGARSAPSIAAGCSTRSSPCRSRWRWRCRWAACSRCAA